MKCPEVREELPAYVRGEQPTLAVRRHLSTCEGCREESARYESLAGALGALQSMTVEPPSGLKHALVAIPSNQGRLGAVRTHVTRHRRRYVGGAAVAVAGTAGALLLRRRLVAA